MLQVHSSDVQIDRAGGSRGYLECRFGQLSRWQDPARATNTQVAAVVARWWEPFNHHRWGSAEHEYPVVPVSGHVFLNDHWSRYPASSQQVQQFIV